MLTGVGRRAAVLVVGVVAAWFLVGSDYRFILVDRQAAQYSTSTFGRVVKDYAASRRTFLPIGGDKVEVEHPVIASSSESRELGLPPGNYLRFALICPAEARISAIQVTHTYGGVPLEVAGTYLLRDASSKGEAAVEKLEANPISVEGAFRYVRVYRFPADAHASLWVPRPLWFLQTLREHIELKGAGEERNFDLEAWWRRAGSPWWRWLRIT